MRRPTAKPGRGAPKYAVYATHPDSRKLSIEITNANTAAIGCYAFMRITVKLCREGQRKATNRAVAALPPEVSSNPLSAAVLCYASASITNLLLSDTSCGPNLNVECPPPHRKTLRMPSPSSVLPPLPLGYNQSPSLWGRQWKDVCGDSNLS